MVQAAKPALLEEAIALVCDKYDILVEQATDEYAKENSECNPFAPVQKQNKSEKIAQEVKAHLEDLNRRFDAMFMAQEQGHQPPRTFQRDRNRPYNPHCYNCSELGHISKDCTAPCSICKEPSHSNFICEFNPINHDHKPQGLMMAEQNFEAGKRALSSSATPQPLNKKSNLEYIVDPDGPSFPFTLIRKCQVCSRGPSPGCELTPPPMKRTDCKDAPSPSVFLPHIHDETGEGLEHPSNLDPPREPPSSPLPPRVYVRDSKWNPCHTNRFVSLEIEDVFKNEDHYPCLPDLNKYLPFEDNPCYNIVTVESVPKSPRTSGGFYDLPSEMPSLEASPTGAAAWRHRATSQDGRDKGPAAFGSHHCSHPGHMGPAMVSQVNSPGFGPIRSLNVFEVDGKGLSADTADLGEPIRSSCNNKFNVFLASYNVDVSNQPIKLHASQDAREQHTLYDPHNLAQPIISSGATCNSMQMAPSELSNLNKPITPDNTMESNSPNVLINDCNLNEPITPEDAMEIDSPNVLINDCNLNGPITPEDTMEIDSPNVLINNCDSDGPIRSGATGAKFTHSDQAGCPTPSHPIKSRVAKKLMHPMYCTMIAIWRSQSDLALLVQIILIKI
ncbi:hypothetical protein DSO57_1034043 [Entomophthora muscae]|uniref:Uncharacterized protein n=1 Tax=Entomophthora muscae TaxID=34485 RepID=A0ACC2REQ2_9FUNG|nr:hypothetical protein DSO57_1034043 [Entomophthora muscae]